MSTDTFDDTVAVVDAFPDCDVHLLCRDRPGVPAAYDCVTTAMPGGRWGYHCEECFAEFGPGRLGLGIGQRLVLAGDS